MKRLIAAACGCVLAAAVPGCAQSLDDLNIQVHGYVTQGFLYTTNNNIFTTRSSDGSPAWTDAVLNISAQPTPKLRVAVQGRYFLLGNYGNAVTLDWAAADYKADDRFGVRFGKVKTPTGLFNEIQDIDPSYIWALLPESVYPIDNRESYLTHYGGVVYGTIAIPHKFGKLEYRAFGGEGLYTAKDGYFVNQLEAGFNLPNDIKGPLYGGALHWRTPVSGLMVGASALKDNTWNAVYTANNGALQGTETLLANTQPNFFAIYEKNKIMVASEYTRSWGDQLVQFPDTPDSYARNDDRGWYAMASYKITPKFTLGGYISQNSDHQAPISSSRHYNEWVISGRYDFTEFLYVKAEEHFIHGTGLAYDMNLNPNLQPNTNLTALKVGVTF
jgi:hypothetical protein